MSLDKPSDQRRATGFSFGALILYGSLWAALTAAAAFAVIAILDGEETVTLPPVEAMEMTAAARTAGCEFRRGGSVDSAVPTSGRAGTPARAGIYEEPPRGDALVGALRDGVIVIHYRRDLPDARVDELHVVQRAVPTGTIVTRNDRMKYLVVATAWRRQVGCPRMTDGALDALRLFQGRYIGQGAAGR